jgi:uncharacterized Zn-binding protein involved in type VI secretion
MKHPICLGDPTTGGGRVSRCQLAGTHTTQGVPVAVLGDSASCPLHQGVFTFREGHPVRKMNGIPVVLEGHRLTCGCHAMARHALTVRSTF